MYLNVTHDLKKWIWNTALISKFKKNDRRSSRTPENAKFSNFTMLFAEDNKKCAENYNASTQPLLCSLNPLFSDAPVAMPSSVAFANSLNYAACARAP